MEEDYIPPEVSLGQRVDKGRSKRREQQAARALMKERDIKYTTALRIVRAEK